MTGEPVGEYRADGLGAGDQVWERSDIRIDCGKVAGLKPDANELPSLCRAPLPLFGVITS